LCSSVHLALSYRAGKWHLGFFKEDYLPVNRGFDSFYGYLTGSEDYFGHYHCYLTCGLDFRDNLTVVTTANGTYSAYLFSQRAEQLIRAHGARSSSDDGGFRQQEEQPFFLYLAFQSVHSPLQVRLLHAVLDGGTSTSRERDVYATITIVASSSLALFYDG